mmetsp:Transcript_16427/g.40602  ORF Transcript_16427/g.40602 Transcript_16427/m.40602 type:complete len:950 (-) Transcript_16427:332-3181(-)
MAGVDNSVLFSTLDDNLQDQLRTIAAKGWRNTNFRDNHTLLHWACFHNRIDVLHLLLESSFRDEIDLHVRDRAGHKAIDYATRPEIRRYMDNALKAQNARKKFRTLGAGVGPGVPPGGPGSGAGVQPLRASPDDGFEAPLTITRRTERGSSSGGVENDKLLDLTKMDLVEEESSGTSWLSKISGGFFGGSAAGTASNSSTSAGEDSLSSEPSISSTGTGYLSGFFGGGSNPATSPFQQQLATVNEDGEVPMYDMLGRPRGPRTSSTASPPIKKAPSTSISASAGAGRLSGSSPPKMKCRMPDCQECPAGKPLPDTGVCLDVCCAPASGPSGGGSAAAGGSLSTQLRNPSSRLKGSSLGKPAFLGEDLTLASHRGDAWVNPRAPLRSERGQNGRTKYEEDGDLIHDQSSGQNLLDLLGTLDPNHKKGSSRGDPTPSRGGSGSYGTVDLATGGNRAASGNHDRFRAMKEAAERDDELDKLNQKRKDEDNDSPWDSDDEDAAFKRAKKKISRKKKKRGDACCYCPTPWGGDVPLTCCGCLCCSVLLCGFLTVLFLCGFYTATAILDLLMPDAPAQAPAYATAANGVPILQNGQPIVMQSNGVALSLAAASGQQQQRQWVVPPQQPPPSQGAQQGTQPQGSYPGQGMMGNGQVPLMPGMVQPQQGRSGFSLSEAIVNMFEGLLPSWLKHGRSSNAVSEVSQQQPSGGVQSRQEVLASGPVPTPTAAPQTASAIDGSLPPSVVPSSASNAQGRSSSAKSATQTQTQTTSAFVQLEERKVARKAARIQLSVSSATGDAANKGAKSSRRNRQEAGGEAERNADHPAQHRAAAVLQITGMKSRQRAKTSRGHGTAFLATNKKLGSTTTSSGKRTEEPPSTARKWPGEQASRAAETGREAAFTSFLSVEEESEEVSDNMPEDAISEAVKIAASEEADEPSRAQGIIRPRGEGPRADPD